MQHDPNFEAPVKSHGGIWVLAALGLASLWLGAVGYGAYMQVGLKLLEQPTANLINLAAIALGPAIVMMFIGFAAREAARAAAKTDNMANLANALVGPMQRSAAAGDSAANLRADIIALDRVVGVAGERLDQYGASLRRDGVVLARALKADVESLRALRAELDGEAKALAGAFAANTAVLRTVTADLKNEAAEANGAVAAQVETFGVAFAQIGARSAQFAEAARTTQSNVVCFDAAITKALDALAHATSLTDSARKATEDLALVAHETARAVRDTTARAVAEAREASRMIRAEARGAPANDAIISGHHVAENIKPPRRTVIPLFKPKAPKPVETRPPEPTPTPANDYRATGYTATLADIVRIAGLEATYTLSPDDLAHIAYAGRKGVEARRQAVRMVAQEDLRRLSSTFRASADARRAAEILRRRPALGDGFDADTQRDLMSAFLLVDAALG